MLSCMYVSMEGPGPGAADGWDPSCGCWDWKLVLSKNKCSLPLSPFMFSLVGWFCFLCVCVFCVCFHCWDKFSLCSSGWLGSQKTISLYPPSARMKGMHHHCPIWDYYLIHGPVTDFYIPIYIKTGTLKSECLLEKNSSIFLILFQKIW